MPDEKETKKAERAIAALQYRGNWMFQERFERRFDVETLDRLRYVHIVTVVPSVRVVLLEEPFRVDRKMSRRTGEEADDAR